MARTCKTPFSAGPIRRATAPTRRRARRARRLRREACPRAAVRDVRRVSRPVKTTVGRREYAAAGQASAHLGLDLVYLCCELGVGGSALDPREFCRVGRRVMREFVCG